MKQTAVLLTLGIIITFFTYCSGSKKAQVMQQAPEKLTFEANVLPLVQAKCSPCHTPGQGKLPAYLTAEATKKDIDDIVTRIELHPGEKGFMPMRHERLSDSAINVFKQWKTDGFVAK